MSVGPLAQTAREKAGNKRTATGAEFLARKRDVLDVSRKQLAEGRKAADRVYKAVGRKAAASQRRTNMERAAPGSRLLLDAAFLVPADSSSAFRSAIRQQVRELGAGGIVASLTGPWPAYNFIQ